MRLYRKFTLLFLPIGYATMSWSQLTTYVAVPSFLAENFFCDDYTVSNTVYYGAPYAIGSFEILNGSPGVSEGIILTTGTITEISNGPYGPNNQQNAGMDNNAGGYGLLDNLTGGVPTYNASVLEFDLFTLVDSIEFEVVFGSEEYLEYVGSEYTDPFAVFISGPGFAGVQNIARLPNGEAIHVNTIHPSATNAFGSFGPVNAQFYVSNANGPILQYNGYTVPIKVKADLVPNNTYHLIIGIADAGDGVFDSGVFLQKCSANFEASVAENSENGARCYPNPANNGEITLRSEEEMEYTLFGESCNALQMGTLQGEAHISGLAPGLYIVRFVGKTGTSVKKIIVQ